MKFNNTINNILKEQVPSRKDRLQAMKNLNTQSVKVERENLITRATVNDESFSLHDDIHAYDQNWIIMNLSIDEEELADTPGAVLCISASDGCDGVSIWVDIEARLMDQEGNYLEE
jgi:hypothetical protein